MFSNYINSFYAEGRKNLEEKKENHLKKRGTLKKEKARVGEEESKKKRILISLKVHE